MKPPDRSCQSFLPGDKEYNRRPSISSEMLLKSPVSTTSAIKKPPDKIESVKIESNQKPTSNQSKKAFKGRKSTTASRSKKLQKKVHRKVNKVHKEKIEKGTKDVILVEEDSLHATMDLGGTTIPAEPTKNDSST